MLLRLGLNRSCLRSHSTTIFRKGLISGNFLNFHQRQRSTVLPLSSKNGPHSKAWKKYIVLVAPAVYGIVWYCTREEQTLLGDIFASPTLIPCIGNVKVEHENHESQTLILSPDEEDLSIVRRLSRFVENYIWEPLLTARRFVHLFVIFVPVLLSLPMMLVGQPEAQYRGDNWGAVWWYGQLVSAMERAGPTFIKLGQWAASRADLFPRLLCDRLGSLHSSSKPHSFVHTKRIIERVFQRPFEEVFEEFDRTPIGVGAVAQVYRATLRHDLLPTSYLNPKRKSISSSTTFPTALPNEPPPSIPAASVAIKVLHPRVTNMIMRDIAIMRIFANAFSILPGMQWLSLPQEVDVFGHMMAGQLDLRNEAENLLVFERNFGPRKSAVTFPRPLTAFTSREVLIEEFENAIPLKSFLKNGGGPYDDQIAELGLDAFLNMLLLDNFVHSDLHAGNMMVKFYKPTTGFLIKNIISSIFHTSQPHDPLLQPEAKETESSDAIVDRLRSIATSREKWIEELKLLSEDGFQPEIVFLDTGLVTTLTDENRRNFLDLFRAIAEFDGYRAGTLMIERSRSPQLAVDPETFALKMQHIVLSVKRKTFSLGQIKISDILTDVLRAVREHHVRMEGDFINTVISVLLLEGIGRQLDPSLDLFKSALPILRKLGRQMTAQESMESMANLPRSNLGAYLKVWVWLEARELASSALVNLDDLIRYDWLTPNI